MEGRLLNHLTGLDAVAQVGKDLFAPSRKSRVFAVPHQAAALKYWHVPLGHMMIC